MQAYRAYYLISYANSWTISRNNPDVYNGIFPDVPIDYRDPYGDPYGFGPYGPYGDGYDGYGYDDYGYGYDDYGYGYDDYGYGYDDYGYGYDDYGYGYDDYGYGDDGYGYGDDGYGDDGYGPDEYGEKYGEEPSKEDSDTEEPSEEDKRDDLMKELLELRELIYLRNMINSTIHAAKQFSLACDFERALALIAVCVVKISRSNVYMNGNPEILTLYERIQALGRFIQEVMKDGQKCEESETPKTLPYKVQEYYANTGIANQSIVVASASGPSGPSTQTGTFYSR
jgi:hypothetical protein